jgi:cytochrome P450 family 6
LIKVFKNYICFQTETLRKYPPVDNLLRTASKDYKIPDSNLIIEKDTLTFIPVIGIHYNPEIYPEPETFDPERFTDEKKTQRHPMAHLPFGRITNVFFWFL